MYLTGNEVSRCSLGAAGDCVDNKSELDVLDMREQSKKKKERSLLECHLTSNRISWLSSMFLVAIMCLRLQRCLGSQMHFFQQPTSPNLRHTTTNHYLSQPNQNQHHFFNGASSNPALEDKTRADGLKKTAIQQPFRPSIGTHPNQHHNQQQSNRRASSGADSVDQGTGGRVLVCYYTTRNSPPYWPPDAQGYIIPAENVPGFPPPPGPEPRYASESSFSPVAQLEQIQYEARGLHQSNEIGKGKLLFKSAHSPARPATSSFKTISEFSPLQHEATSSEALLLSQNNGNMVRDNKQLFEQVFAPSSTHKQFAEADHHNRNNNRLQQVAPMVVFAGPSNANNNNSDNKINKQPLATYSLLNGLESTPWSSEVSSGGGIVVQLPQSSTRTVREPTPAVYEPTTTTTTIQNGRNNGFVAKLDAATNHQHNHHLERVSHQQQEQQLVLSPSLSRAFIVGGGSSSSSNNNNNEVLSESNSQLFITGGQSTAERLVEQHQQVSGGSGTNYLRQQQQTVASSSSAVSRPPAPVTPTSMRTKHFQVTASEQLSPVDFSFGGTVSSASQVPLSPASSSLRATAHQFNPNNHLMQQQMIVPSSTGVKYNKPAEESVIQTLRMPNSTSGSGHSTNSFSSALISSPLSSVFDVFGAASQYLMRFKPSSLISPSSFMFNTLAASKAATSHLPGLRPNPADANVSSTASLISLPSSLVIGPSSASLSSSQLQMKPQPASLGTGRSSAPIIAENSSLREQQSGGFLSRFSVLQSNNQQRREDVCGKTIQSPQRRIIGGEGARYGEFPYQVHIKIAKHQCGGALIDRQSIVTAAHCVYHFITRAPVNKLQIVIGAYDIEDEQYQELPPQYFKVNKVKLHPNFKFSASHPDRYDIAILKLDKPVKYTDNVLPVCLPSRDFKLENMVGTVTGFGKTDPSLSNRYGTRLLQKVDVPIIENNECERWHRTRGIDLKIFPEMMCAGYEDGLKDACVGDSGGPLVVKSSSANGPPRWTLAGITSAGFGCAQSRQPGIYHRVSHTVDWILENLD